MKSRHGTEGITIGGSRLSQQNRYQCLFGEPGAALAESEWIAQANSSLPPQLSALNARFDAGSRSDTSLRVSYHPGPERFTSFMTLSGGSVAEMLDQAAAHCGTLVTSHGCPTLTMTVNYLRAGTGRLFIATARVLTVTSTSAVLGSDLADEQGRRIASASVVAQLIKDITRYT